MIKVSAFVGIALLTTATSATGIGLDVNFHYYSSDDSVVKDAIAAARQHAGLHTGAEMFLDSTKDSLRASRKSLELTKNSLAWAEVHDMEMQLGLPTHLYKSLFKQLWKVKPQVESLIDGAELVEDLIQDYIDGNLEDLKAQARDSAQKLMDTSVAMGCTFALGGCQLIQIQNQMIEAAQAQNHRIEDSPSPIEMTPIDYLHLTVDKLLALNSTVKAHGYGLKAIESLFHAVERVNMVHYQWEVFGYFNASHDGPPEIAAIGTALQALKAKCDLASNSLDDWFVVGENELFGFDMWIASGKPTHSDDQQQQEPAFKEFYFGNTLPYNAGPGAVLDGGEAYSHGKHGWHCGGSTAVSGGASAPLHNSEQKSTQASDGCAQDLGYTRIDKHAEEGGDCVNSGEVVWEVAVPNDNYTVEVKFGRESPLFKAGPCYVEGVVAEQQCISRHVEVKDGRFTITGNKKCHSIAMVKLEQMSWQESR